ncbi:2OG-Fe(II) oxygenase family protein [Sphingomonas sp. CJ99]
MSDADIRAGALRAYAAGTGDAAQRVAEALRTHPEDGALLIADAVLAAQARRPDALARIDAMLFAAPDWLDGHVARAELAWAMGDRDGYLAMIHQALGRLPRHGGLWMRLMRLMAGTGRSAEAADVALRLRRTGGDVAPLRLIEARHAGAAGQTERAGTLLASLPEAMAEAWTDRGRHALRMGDPAVAESWLARSRQSEPDNPAVWALTELSWRAVGDSRHDWLMRPDTMIRRMPLLDDAATLSGLAGCLRKLHHDALPPIGQSVRAGTQTRGALAERGEPEIRALFDRISVAIDAYRAALPPADPSHPLLRHRDRHWTITASWSIRLTGGGHHVSHLHDHGVLSSACHIAVPAMDDPGSTDGWLELGRAPADLPLAVPPVAIVQPQPGTLVLFPSFLYHGTRPVSAGERLTVALDIAPTD